MSRPGETGREMRCNELLHVFGSKRREIMPLPFIQNDKILIGESNRVSCMALTHGGDGQGAQVEANGGKVFYEQTLVESLKRFEKAGSEIVVRSRQAHVVRQCARCAHLPTKDVTKPRLAVRDFGQQDRHRGGGQDV